MSRRKGASSITPERRLQWLKRHEGGESIFKIAIDAGFDQRTVKRHVELAKNEREFKEERSSVLRGALEHHFSDLLSVVDIMLTHIDTGETVELSGDEEFLQDALREHIPRSAIWLLLRNWNSYVAGVTLLKAQIRDRLEKTVSSDATLAAINERKNDELFRRMRSALKAEERNHGHPGLDVKVMEIEERANQLRAVNSAFTTFGELDDKKELAVVQAILAKIQSKMEAWEEFTELGDQYRKLADARTKLKEALRILKWKRIVPGRCRLCPM